MRGGDKREAGANSDSGPGGLAKKKDHIANVATQTARIASLKLACPPANVIWKREVILEGAAAMTIGYSLSCNLGRREIKKQTLIPG